MATPLGNFFSANEKIMSQCDDETLGSTAETLVIQFDQEKFEQLLSKGGPNPISMRKHKKILVAMSPLDTARKQVSNEIKEATCRPNSVTIKIKLALRQHLYAAYEPRSASKAFWSKKSFSALCEAKRSIA